MTSNQIAARDARTREAGLEIDREKARAATRTSKAAQSQAKTAAKRQKTDRQQGWVRTVTGGIGDFGKAASGGAALTKVLSNHPEWYNLNPQLVNDVSSFAFGQPLGSKIPVSFLPPDSQYVPSFMSIFYTPVLPISGDIINSPINVAARNLYSFVRYANSGARNYEAADLMTYLLLMETAISLVGYGARAYAIITHGDMHNWDFPETAAKAAGFNYISFKSNIAQLRYKLNSFIQQMNAFAVPKTMPIFDRRFWLTHSMFRDSELKKSQVYMFVPKVLYSYDWEKVQVKPMDTWVTNIGNLTYAQFETVLDTFITSMLQIEDVGIISGDILKAFGESNLHVLSSIPNDYAIPLIYDADILMQIAHATTWGDFNPNDMAYLTIRQDGLNLYQGNELKLGVRLTGDSRVGYRLYTGPEGNIAGNQTLQFDLLDSDILVNMYKDNVEPIDVMRATRLTSTGLITASSTNITSCGTELVNYCLAYNFPQGVFGKYISNYVESGVAPTVAEFESGISVDAAFDWSPFVRKWRYLALGNPLKDQKPILKYSNIDFANFSFIKKENCINMHNVAVQSLYAIPLVGMTKRNR